MTKWGSWFGSFATAGAEVRLGEPVAVPFRQFTAGCPICEAAASAGGLPFINHGNCTAPGSVGHKPADQGHCTARACY